MSKMHRIFAKTASSFLTRESPKHLTLLKGDCSWRQFRVQVGATVLVLCLAWTLMGVPVQAANSCSGPAQDESWIDQGVDTLAVVCSTWVLEPIDTASSWLGNLFRRNDSKLSEDQIELEIVDVSQWDFLDEIIKDRFFDVGLDSDMPRRTEVEAEALYEAIPGTARALGEERLIEFLGSHTLTYVEPIEEILRLADAEDNLVWELQTVSKARGERPMTVDELVAAVNALERKGQAASTLSHETWYALNQDQGFMDGFKRLGLATGTRTQAEAFELYMTIPEAFRNEGVVAVRHFLKVHAPTFRTPVEANPQLASTFVNVVWEDRRLQTNRDNRPMTDSEIAAAEQALWAKSLTAGTPSSRTWYKLLLDPEALAWLRLAGNETLPGFAGSQAELLEVYESIPGAVRAAGFEAVRMFLSTHSPVYRPGLVIKDSANWYLSRATSLDNLVWEAHELAEARGQRAMTLVEIHTAEQVLRTRFESAANVMALGMIPEIPVPQPELEDIPGDVRRRLARIGLTSEQPGRMPSEIVNIYASIPSPIRALGEDRVENFLDRYTISHPTPAASEPGHQVQPSEFTWEKHGTVHARGDRPMSFEEFQAAKMMVLLVALDAMPEATWSVLENNPEFKTQFSQIESNLLALGNNYVHINVNIDILYQILYQNIPRSVVLLGPDAVLRFLSEFGLSHKRPVADFLALTDVPTNMTWEPNVSNAVRDITVQDNSAPVPTTRTELKPGTDNWSVTGPGYYSAEGDSWETLDEALQQRLAFVGLTPNTWYRTLSQTVALYQTIPEGVRSQGNVAVRDFLDSYTVSRRVPLSEYWELATSARNSVWEESKVVQARGGRPANEAEVTAAREALVETYSKDLEAIKVLEADGRLTGLVTGVYVGSKGVLPKLQTPPPPVTSSGTWHTLDPLLRQRFAGRGLPVGMPRRTALEAQILYETVPLTIRVQGNTAVRDFLDTHALSYRRPVTEFPDLARVPGNAVWEPLDLALARGDRPLTPVEAHRARQAVEQAARSAATRSGMTWYALNDDPAFLHNLRRRGGTSWTPADARKLYTKIPLGIRNQGPKAVKTFLDEFDLSHIEPLSTNDTLANSVDNVIWEDPSRNRARGASAMTPDEVADAKEYLKDVGSKAGSRSNRTWYAIAQNPERLERIRNLGVSDGNPHSRLMAKGIYEKIPLEIRELGVNEVDNFIEEFDLSHKLGRAVTESADTNVVWEKQSSKRKRGSGPMTEKQVDRARKDLDNHLADAATLRKALRSATRKTAIATVARTALKVGLLGAVVELPISGAESFLEWHHGRLTGKEAVVQAARNSGASALFGIGILGGLSLVPTVATFVVGTAPVIVPAFIAGGTVHTLNRLCTAAQPGTASN